MFLVSMSSKILRFQTASGGFWWRLRVRANRACSWRKASTELQSSRIGDQTGGRVFLFLQTDDFWSDYHAMRSKGLRFNEEPRRESYGTVAVFEDLYGNRWDLLQRI